MGFLINPYLVQPSGPSYDSDAQAFFTAAGITDTTQKSAVNQLVLDLKSYSIWTKMKALYPFVGGTASTHKWNLKDTTQYEIAWSGGITHSSTGVLPNGTNSTGNPQFTFNSSNQSSSHISFYSRTNSQATSCEIGSGDSGGTYEAFIITRTSSDTAINSQCNGSVNRLTPSVTNSQGLFLNSRTSWSSWKTYKNGTSLASNTSTVSYVSDITPWLFVRKQNNDLYSAKECAFASIGDGLTDTEAANFYTAVQAFQTTLSRNV